MRDLKAMFKCTAIILRRRFCTSKTYLVLVIEAIFCFYTYSALGPVTKFFNQTLPPFLLPFYFGQMFMLLIHGGLCLLLFSDVGENDGYSYLMIHRCGRKAYMAGQILEILVTALLYALYMYVMSLIFVIPVLGWDSDWGTMLNTLAFSRGEIADRVDLTGVPLIYSEILSIFTPLQATLAALACIWCSGAFLGMIICVCRVYFEKMTGIVISGFIVGISLFALAIGRSFIGEWVLYISPMSWADFMRLDWYYSGFQPSPVYAFSVWIAGILIMGALSMIGFNKRDVQ